MPVRTATDREILARQVRRVRPLLRARHAHGVRDLRRRHDAADARHLTLPRSDRRTLGEQTGVRAGAPVGPRTTEAPWMSPPSLPAAALAAGTVASAGAEFVTGLPSWLAAGLTLAGGFGWLRYVWLPKAEKRLRNAQAASPELSGDRISLETAEEVVKFARGECALLKGELSDVRENYRKERVRADEAHQRLIETQAALAGAQAQLAEAVARSSSDRSTL